MWPYVKLTKKPMWQKGWCERMAKGRVIIDDGFCKGCGLCVDVCPTHILELDKQTITPKGYHPAVCTDETRCTGCATCALMCPDVAITVYREVRS